MKKIFFVIFLFLPVIAMDQQEQEDGPDCCDIMKVIFIGFLRQLPSYPQTPRIYPLQRLPKHKKRTRPQSEKED